MNKKQKNKSDELKRVLEKLSDSALDRFKEDIEKTQEARNSLKEKEDDFSNCIDEAIKLTDMAYDLMKAMDVITDNSAKLYAILLDEELDDIKTEVKKSGETTITAKFVSGRSYTYKIKMPQPLENAEIAAYKLANL